jgi:uncharacterized protein (TIGR00725 family)
MRRKSRSSAAPRPGLAREADHHRFGAEVAEREQGGSRRRPIIGIMGAGQASRGSLAAARELGALVAERGWIVLTGGRPAGVMAAACAGAKQVRNSLTLGILPGAEGAGSDVDIAVFTAMGDARNTINVLTSDVVVACGVEGPGTASEVSLALKAGKPVILLAAAHAARVFFESLRAPGRLIGADAPIDVVRLIEVDLAIPRWSP